MQSIMHEPAASRPSNYTLIITLAFLLVATTVAALLLTTSLFWLAGVAGGILGWLFFVLLGREADETTASGLEVMAFRTFVSLVLIATGPVLCLFVAAVGWLR